MKIGGVWDPDDLFTKHTVAEVKVIQRRLRSVLLEYSLNANSIFFSTRADADAKQEELRLMVGCVHYL